MTEKEQFLGTLEREIPTTMRVLKAYPGAKADMKPHGKCKSTKEPPLKFVNEQTASQPGPGGERGHARNPASFAASGTGKKATHLRRGRRLGHEGRQ